MDVRVRYAPSPTGYLHIGNARTALFNYLFARRHGGSFIVRIEDTDVARNVDTGVEDQLSLLRWLGIDWDESIDKEGGVGPYRQLDRLEWYRHYAEALIESGMAYRCYCTDEELEAIKREQEASGADRFHYPRRCLDKPEQDAPYAIRFKVPDATRYAFDDLIKDTVTFQSEDIGDWVIMKRNGIPTYNFACAIDDALMKISHVLRGEDHITNTPRQLMVLDALGFKRPIYGHMPLIVDKDGRKLSKRSGSVLQYISQFKERGFLPEALFNFIALLGWSPDAEAEVFTPGALVERFDENRLSGSPATFDAGKLHYLNHQHIQRLELDEAVALCRPFLESEGITEDKDPAWVRELVSLLQERLDYGAEIVDLYHAFFKGPFTLETEAREFLAATDGAATLLGDLKGRLQALDTFDADAIKQAIKQAGKATGMKGKQLFMPVRIAISGRMKGPDLPRMISLLGRETVLQRVSKTLDTLE